MTFKLSDFPPHVQAAIRKQEAADRDRAAPAPKLAKALPRTSTLNKTEQAYANHLELRRRAGEIADFRVQAMTFLIGPGCRYTPDFCILENDGTFTLVDVKGGHTWEDSVVKLKTAADKFPFFRWQMVEKRGEAWNTVRSLPAEITVNPLS